MSNKKEPADTLENIPVSELKGLWYSSGYTVDYRAMGLYMDTDVEFISEPEYLYFGDDSVWSMVYPCRLMGSGTTISTKWYLNDGALSNGGKRTYTQVDFDSLVVRKIIEDEFVPSCYTGQWYLVNGESGGDGTGYDYIYPFEIKDTLFINETNISLNEIKDGTIELEIGGKLRPFYFQFTTSSYENLHLKPTETWNEEDRHMWKAFWRDGDWSQNEIEALKQEPGEDLKIRFTKSAF